MILVDGKKFACETCVTGHRAFACRHPERSLVEIKKKGRPTTICEHCRELRKTKQVYLNCACGPDDSAGSSLESGGCMCITVGICLCWTPRKGAPRSKRRNNSELLPEANAQESHCKGADSLEDSAALSSQILTRVAGLRPVLPRLDDAPPLTYSSDQAEGTHEALQRHTHALHGNLNSNIHANAHDHTLRYANDFFPSQNLPQDLSLPIEGLVEQKNNSGTISQVPWGSPTVANISSPRLSPCGCVDACSCPGCIPTNGDVDVASSSTSSSCSSPAACVTCLDCTILSVISQPSDGLSADESYPSTSVISDWSNLSDVGTAFDGRA